MSIRDRVVEMKQEVEELRKDYSNNTLATEMLGELKATSKRKDIIIIILIGVIVAMVIAYFIHENQFETVSEESTQEAYYTDNSTVTQNID